MALYNADKPKASCLQDSSSGLARSASSASVPVLGTHFRVPPLPVQSSISWFSQVIWSPQRCASAVIKLLSSVHVIFPDLPVVTVVVNVDVAELVAELLALPETVVVAEDVADVVSELVCDELAVEVADELCEVVAVELYVEVAVDVWVVTSQLMRLPEACCSNASFNAATVTLHLSDFALRYFPAEQSTNDLSVFGPVISR